MYYIFNKDGNCVCSATYELNADDLASRNETAVESIEIYELDKIKLVNGVIVAIEPSLDELKKAKLTEVDQWTASKITGGFVSNCYNGENILYDTDTETQLTMTKARANCEGERFAQAFPNGMGVRGYAQTGTDADGTMVFANTKTIYNFLPEHIIAWDEDFSLHLAKCKYEGWVMQDKVNKATTVEELEAIVLE
jgi:hypothetical protein